MCKYINDVYFLKDLLGQGGEHAFIRKMKSLFVYLQSEVLNAFCTFKSYASTMIRKTESDILDKSILHSLMVKYCCGIDQF